MKRSQNRSAALLVAAAMSFSLLFCSVPFTTALAGSWFADAFQKKPKVPVGYPEAMADSCFAVRPEEDQRPSDAHSGGPPPSPKIFVQRLGPVNAVSVSPDGRMLAAAGRGGILQLWDMPAGRLVWSVTAHEDPLGIGAMDVAFSPDGRFIYTVCLEDKGLVKWDVRTGREAGRIPVPILKGGWGNQPGACFNELGTHVFLTLGKANAVGVFDASALYELPSGKRVAEFRGTAVTISPNGRYVLTEVQDPEEEGLFIYDACKNGRAQKIGKKSYPLPMALLAAFSPDNETLAVAYTTGGKRDRVALYRPDSGKTLGMGPEMDDGPIGGLAFSGDGRHLFISGVQHPAPASAWADFKLVALDAKSGAPVKRLASGSGGSTTFAQTPDGRFTVAQVRGDGGRFDIQLIRNDTLALDRSMRGYETGAAFAMAGDGRLVSAAHVWDLAVGQPVKQTGLPADGRFQDLHVLPGDRELFSISRDKGGRQVALARWAMDGGAATWRKDIPVAGWGEWVSVDPTGRFLEVYAVEGSTRVLDLSSDREVLAVPCPPGGHVYRGVFSPDGRLYAAVSWQAGGRAKLTVWGLDSGRARAATALPDFPGNPAMGFGPDGRWLVASFDTTGSGRRVQTLMRIDLPSGDVRFRKKANSDSPCAQLAVSPDGRVAARRFLDGRVEVLDTASGDVVSRTDTLSTEAGRFFSFSPDGSRLVAAGKGTAWVFDTASGRLLARLMEFEGGQWLSMSPEGYYAASKSADQLLNVSIGDRVQGLVQYYEVFYRPDLVAENLAYKGSQPLPAAEPKRTLAEVAAAGGPPMVSFVSPADRGTLSVRDVEVVVALSDTGGGIGKLEWKINGVTVGVSDEAGRGISVAGHGPADVPGVTVKSLLTLSPGENVIEVVAANRTGEVVSTPATLTLTCKDEISERPSLYILTVGINAYRDGSLRLTYSVPDAQAISTALADRAGPIFETIVVEPVFDDKATLEGIGAAFEKLGRVIRTQDVFVFYVAGHGVSRQGRYHLLPFDFRYRSDASIAAEGIGQDRIQRWLASIPARKSIVFLDTCNSGAFTAGQAAARGIAEKVAIDRLTRATGRAIIVAAKDDQPALEGYQGHGVFTYVLLKGFEEADRTAGNRDGQTSIFELAAYVDAHVPDITLRQFGYEQVPQVNMQGRDFPIAVAR